MPVNLMTLDGKEINGTSSRLNIQLGDDLNEVRGFGKPISIAYAKQMVRNYIATYLEAVNMLAKIDSDTSGNYNPITSDPDYTSLKSILSLNNHVISGVFGKELFLQILSQKDCEGIRYVFGQNADDDGNNQTTIILLGVKETDGDTKGVKNSEPLPFRIPIDQINDTSRHDQSDPLVGEVHVSSKTVKEIADLMGIIIPENGAENFQEQIKSTTDNITNQIFSVL